jgi:hypothetical protein
MLLLLACITLPPHQEFPTLSKAFSAVLEKQPKVLGIGELHTTTTGPQGPTTLSRFTTELLPLLSPGTTDLVLETWRLNPECYQQAKAVSETIQQDLKRPEATKTELELLIEAAIALKIQPHDLLLSCEEYAQVQIEGELDYGTLLTVVTQKLQAYGEEGFNIPEARVVLYGGAVHNDVVPNPDQADYSYGKALGQSSGYIELDLYNPAILKEKPALVEESWAPLLEKAGPGKVILYARSARSYVILTD